ncbi:MAG TPA: PAS domain S-box protein, partial [Dehalococcoidales bacterium]|nr:PAS domain S-box protein [Dehalococcoidales bacterium]
SKVILNYHFWILLAILVLLSLFHYSTLGSLIPYSQFGIARHSVERILFLIPIIYSAIILGLTGGLVFLTVSFAVMLPNALTAQTGKVEAIIEVSGITVVGLLINGWFYTLQNERKRHLKTIAQLEKTQQSLLTEEKRLEALSGISHNLSHISDLQTALEGIMEQVAKVTNFEVVLLYTLNKTGDELTLRAHHGVSEEFTDGLRWLKVGEGMSGKVALTGEPLVVEDITTGSVITRDIVLRENVVGWLIVPVKSWDKVTGTLAVGVRRPIIFDKDVINLLVSFGDEIGVALENNRLYKEQIFMAQQLRESERNYRELFEKAHDSIWVHDLDGYFLTSNEAMAKMAGYRREELLDMNVKTFLDEESLMIARDVARKLLSGAALVQPYEQKFIQRDGTVVYLMLTTSLLMRDGKPQAYQHIARDVTAQRRMNENLRFYVQQITRAQEEERKRIARELHDDTAQQLIVLSRQLDKLLSTNKFPVAESGQIEGISQRVDSILDGVRRFSQDLRPSVLDDLGLLPAVEWLASDMTEHFDTEVSVEKMGTERRFSPEKELLLFRIVQESLSNIRKHAAATRAKIIFEFNESQTVVTITDNGKGFTPPERLSDLAGLAKLGLAGMAERARLLDGGLRLDSESGKGTSVILTVPN